LDRLVDVHRSVNALERGMGKPTIPSLTVRERIALFCAGSSIDPEAANISSDIVTAVIVKGLIQRDTAGRLSLTDEGRKALRALLGTL
jgi:hypothetical protein